MRILIGRGITYYRPVGVREPSLWENVGKQHISNALTVGKKNCQ